MVHPALCPPTSSPRRGASHSQSPSSSADPILPWLRSVDRAFEDYRRSPEDRAGLENYTRILEGCVRKFVDDHRYEDDIRLIRVLVLYADAIQDFKSVFELMEEKGVGLGRSLMYEAYALFLVARGKLTEANGVFHLGISRNAEPIGRLQRIHALFLKRVNEVSASAGSNQNEHATVNPWSASSINDLLAKIDHHITKYNGYCKTSKAYPGKVSLSSLQNSSRNKIIELGGKKYQIKGCSGQGGFAQVFKAYIDNNPEDVVALKIQRPAFPWEFYMYRQLDMRIPDTERSRFGVAHKIHIYSDWSILVTQYFSHGTLQDAINSYLVMQKHMEEVLCIFYTIEMLRMLESLHTVGIIHGDFKPDNLLVRYAGDDLPDDGFRSRTGSWRDPGLCLVDWGRGIDLSLFPAGTQFMGDSRTSGFRCVEMQENKLWSFQVDTYGLCVIVHMMLHGSYMSIEKKVNSDGSYHYQPKSHLKRYWNVDLWKNLFSTLLNRNSHESDVPVLQSLRKSFEDYISESSQLVRKLKELLAKQRASLCSA